MNYNIIRKLYKNQSLTKNQVEYCLDNDIDSDWLYAYQNNKMTPRLINKAMNEFYDLSMIYRYCGYKMTEELIKKAIDKGDFLWDLFENCSDKINNYLVKYTMEKATKEDVDLESLYAFCYKKLEPEDIQYAIDNYLYLNFLYESCYSIMTEDLINYAIKYDELGTSLQFLYVYCGYKMTPNSIELAIDKNRYLNFLYRYCKNMNSETIDYAIENTEQIGDLWTLYNYHSDEMTDEQKEKLKLIGISYNN